MSAWLTQDELHDITEALDRSGLSNDRHFALLGKLTALTVRAKPVRIKVSHAARDAEVARRRDAGETYVAIAGAIGVTPMRCQQIYRKQQRIAACRRRIAAESMNQETV